MTPKQKAEELFDKYNTFVVMWSGSIETSRQNVKQCALIAVDEILKCDPLSPSTLTGKKTTVDTYKEWEFEALEFWGQVKHEINLL